MTEQLVPCDLCVKCGYDRIGMVPVSDRRYQGGYHLCFVCARFMKDPETGWDPCCGPHGRGCPQGLTMSVVGEKRCASCLEAFKSLHSGR
jgi:hypothetical protein